MRNLGVYSRWMQRFGIFDLPTPPSDTPMPARVHKLMMTYIRCSTLESMANDHRILDATFEYLSNVLRAWASGETIQLHACRKVTRALDEYARQAPSQVHEY